MTLARRHPLTVGLAAIVLVAIGWVSNATTPTADEAGNSRPGPAPTSAQPSRAEPTERSPTPTPSPSPREERSGGARVALAALTVKGRAPKTGYSREMFGQSWRDLDRNGCDQRNDVLRRDLRDIILKAGTRGCLVLSGTLKSPYTGQVIHFTRGTTTSSLVQIDHLVALSDAWQKGAQRWSAQKREQFANDVLELRATDGSSNASKGDGDAATWLPPRTSYRCGYVARQIAVKRAYGLWVTAAERDAMARVLSSCPGQGLPRRYVIPLGGGPEVTPAPVTPAPASPRSLAGRSTTYANCDAVRAAGAAPIRRGDPGYGRRLDRDGDGVGCE